MQIRISTCEIYLTQLSNELVPPTKKRKKLTINTRPDNINSRRRGTDRFDNGTPSARNSHCKFSSREEIREHLYERRRERRRYLCLVTSRRPRDWYLHQKTAISKAINFQILSLSLSLSLDKIDKLNR